MRRMRAVLTAASLAMPLYMANAEEMTAGQKAYTLTLMCAAFAGAEAHYGTDADISRTQRAADKMGKALGYDSDRIFNDLVMMGLVVRKKISADPSEVGRNRVRCRMLKLMD